MGLNNNMEEFFHEQAMGLTDFKEQAIREGNGFRAYKEMTIPAGGTVYISGLTSPDHNLYLFGRTLHTQKPSVEFRVYSGGTWSGGTAIPIWRMNNAVENYSQSSFYFQPTVTTLGTEIDFENIWGLDNVGGRSSGSFNNDFSLRIYPPSGEFIFSITNNFTESQIVTLSYRWAEIEELM